MATTTAIIHVRLNESIKKRAAKSFESMGLSVSDAIRIFMTRAAKEKGFPFSTCPNATTRAAMREHEDGKTKSFDTVEGALKWCNEED